MRVVSPQGMTDRSRRLAAMRHFAAAETYDRAGFGERARRHRERARLFTRFGADANAAHAGEVRDAKALADRLTCMITMQLLVDPVVVSSGHTFERHAIERWIRAHGTCPVIEESDRRRGRGQLGGPVARVHVR